MLGPVFYLGAMGLGLGSLIDKHGTATLGGVPYLVFLAPAILASSAMTTGMDEASFPCLRLDQVEQGLHRARRRRRCGPPTSSAAT